MSRVDPLLTAAELLAQIGSPSTKILDATWVPSFLKDRPDGRSLYQDGHIPSAIYFDIDEIADQESSSPHMLPSASVFAENVGALGLTNDDEVVVYDSNGFFASARVWWMFRAMGYEKIRVLDGGLNAWKAAGGDVETDVSTPEPAVFRAELNPALLKSMDQMRDHIASSDVNILDARATGRFTGTSPEPRPDLPSGHMPGSFCVPSTELIQADGHLKSAQELKPLLEPYTSSSIVTTCGSGVSAAVISLALARLGEWDTALYDGSWSEWAANSDNPIAAAS